MISNLDLIRLDDFVKTEIIQILYFSSLVNGFGLLNFWVCEWNLSGPISLSLNLLSLKKNKRIFTIVCDPYL